MSEKNNEKGLITAITPVISIRVRFKECITFSLLTGQFLENGPYIRG
jgi:hypothetical protein